MGKILGQDKIAYYRTITKQDYSEENLREFSKSYVYIHLLYGLGLWPI